MVNEVIAVGTGVVQGSMVSYIIEFLIGVGMVYLAILGAVKIWDLVQTSWSALRLDVKMAKDKDISLLKYWKERVQTARLHSRKSV